MTEGGIARKSAKPRETPTSVRRSLVIPVYRNAENISELTSAIVDLSKRIGPGLEIIFVIDGSPDNSAELLMAASKTLPCPSTIVFHSRNFGSFTAIRTGMELAQGDQIAVMAADLQEPPELVTSFFELLSAGKADVVFGKRTGRDDPPLRRLGSNLFWSAYRRFVLPEMPEGGVDIFACNRQVCDAVLSIAEPNSSLVAQLFWVGFRRAFVPYRRRRRQHGKSAWDLSRRFRYMMDSILSYSDAPILVVLWFGIMGCVISLILGVITLVARLSGYMTPPGYATLLLVGLFFGSAILTVQGVLGCYLWRAFENTKRRPLRIVSHVVSEKGAPQ
jgi:glycosyltransferase involved in cell wall biosynthesis